MALQIHDRSGAQGFWDRGGVFVAADSENTCNYPGCWGENKK